MGEGKEERERDRERYPSTPLFFCREYQRRGDRPGRRIVHCTEQSGGADEEEEELRVTEGPVFLRGPRAEKEQAREACEDTRATQ